MIEELLDGGFCRECKVEVAHIVFDDAEHDHGICMICVVNSDLKYREENN